MKEESRTLDGSTNPKTGNLVLDVLEEGMQLSEEDNDNGDKPDNNTNNIDKHNDEADEAADHTHDGDAVLDLVCEEIIAAARC